MYALDGHTVHAKHTACAGPKMYCLYSKVGHGFIQLFAIVILKYYYFSQFVVLTGFLLVNNKKSRFICFYVLIILFNLT